MHLSNPSRRIVLATAFGLLFVGGCAGGSWFGKKDLPPEPKPGPKATSDAVLGDTIGAYTLVGAGQSLRLRGFGIVIGLGENGGGDCPSTIREYLLDYLAREFAPQDTASMRPKYSPRELIDSLDTAVVVVHGQVPAGAPSGTHFDLQVEAVGTQTRSLEGGVLVLCELKRFDVSAAGKGLVSGRSLARARGLVYTNPFTKDVPSIRQSSLRRGFVLGGGKTLEDRSVRLLLHEPSYWTARKIEHRVNERFGQHPEVATAMSKGYITLVTPEKYADKPRHFQELVSHLCLDNTPGQVERKLQQLSRSLDAAPETLRHISLIWEGLGRTVIPHIQPLYTHANPYVCFYSARTGLRLKDINALAPMARIASSDGHACRLLAVREMGECGYPQAARPLETLLNTEDSAVRIAAYESLLNYRRPSVETVQFISVLDPTQYNLKLDIVESKAPPIVYIRRSIEPRIAVFGRLTPITLPLFYNHPDDWVTLNALELDDEITVLWRSRSGRTTPEPLKTQARVVELIKALCDAPFENDDGTPRGIGLNYSQIVEVLATLCETNAIPAQLVMQTAPLPELLGPMELPERPEADVTPLLIEDWDEAGERGEYDDEELEDTTNGDARNEIEENGR